MNVHVVICLYGIFIFFVILLSTNSKFAGYNPFLVYCRELAPGTVSLTGDRAQGDDSKHDSHYTVVTVYWIRMSTIQRECKQISLLEN